MTICLSAFSHPSKAIVCVSDRMVTVGNRTADNAAFKWYAIHGDWTVEFAGDAGLASLVMQRAELALDENTHHRPVDVADVMSAAVNAERINLAKAHYGLGQSAVDSLSLPKRRRLLKDVYLPADFIVSGYSPDGYPHVLSVTGDGESRDCDSLGYWCCGTGQDIALAALGSREQSFRVDVETTLYNLLEARFEAQADPNVGKGETCAFIVPFRHPSIMIDGVTVDTIRNIWRQSRRHPPVGALETLRAALDGAAARRPGAWNWVTSAQPVHQPPTERTP